MGLERQADRGGRCPGGAATDRAGHAGGDRERLERLADDLAGQRQRRHRREAPVALLDGLGCGAQVRRHRHVGGAGRGELGARRQPHERGDVDAVDLGDAGPADDVLVDHHRLGRGADDGGALGPIGRRVQPAEHVERPFHRQVAGQQVQHLEALGGEVRAGGPLRRLVEGDARGGDEDVIVVDGVVRVDEDVERSGATAEPEAVDDRAGAGHEERDIHLRGPAAPTARGRCSVCSPGHGSP